MSRLASTIVSNEQEVELAIQAIASVHESDRVETSYLKFVLQTVDHLSMEHQLKSEIKIKE